MMKQPWLKNLLGKLTIGVVVLGCMVTMPALARVEYSYAVEAERTDNVRLVPENEQSETELSGSVALAAIDMGPTLEVNVSAVADYTDYRNDFFPDDTRNYLNADITWIVRPSSFNWVFQDYYTQTQLDTALPNTPNNVIGTNAFSTGPDLFFRLGPASRIGAGGRVSDYRFEDTLTDSRRASAYVNWQYGVDSSTDVSVNLEHQTADYSETDELNFSKQDLFFRILTQYSRSHFQFDVGASRVNRDNFENVNGHLFRVIWLNQFRADSHFELNASSQYTDTAQDLLNAATADTTLNRAGEQVSGDIFLDKRLEAAYRFGFSASSFELQALYRNEQYEIAQQNDRITRGLHVGAEYVYSNRINLNFGLQLNEYDSVNVVQTNDGLNARLAMNYLLTRNYSIRTEYSFTRQETDPVTNDYSENRVLFSFYYGRHPDSYR